ncbi:hypothetical protein G6F65_011271 [Rhizopus arrhizus]|nr:hypothetical protein G6F65_011271 [Rhizopus arrhizus]
MAEVISTAGGVRLDALDDGLMLRALPGAFCAGEMLDWEAPTGGYLLTACYASGLRAAEGVIGWLAGRSRAWLASAIAGRSPWPAHAHRGQRHAAGMRVGFLAHGNEALPLIERHGIERGRQHHVTLTVGHRQQALHQGLADSLAAPVRINEQRIDFIGIGIEHAEAEQRALRIFGHHATALPQQPRVLRRRWRGRPGRDHLRRVMAAAGLAPAPRAQRPQRGYIIGRACSELHDISS